MRNALWPLIPYTPFTPKSLESTVRDRLGLDADAIRRHLDVFAARGLRIAASRAGTDSGGQILNGHDHYTMTFDQDALPPVDRSRGGFWSLTMYNKDIFMLADAPGGRVNLGDQSAPVLVLRADRGQPWPRCRRRPPTCRTHAAAAPAASNLHPR